MVVSGAGPHERVIYTSSLAPAPIGPYNQAVSVDDVLYISGQVGGHNDNGNFIMIMIITSLPYFGVKLRKK